jgi:hypothetical protein
MGAWETGRVGHRNRRRAARPSASSASSATVQNPRAVDRVEEWPDGDWVVRSITGSASTKNYRCPGCDHEIRPATPHVVAWPAEDGERERGLGQRRHWHTACWRARGRRGPR